MDENKPAENQTVQKNPEKKKNWFVRHKILTAIIAILLIGVVASAAGGGSESASNSQAASEGSGTTQTASENKSDELAKIGTPVRDGKFEFTVKSLECGKTSVGGEYLNKTAQGQFCLLNVTVKNIGNEPQSLFSDNQYLFNSQNQKYSADSTATLYAAPDGNDSWYSEINPGNSVEGSIVFDVPKDVTPVSAELHDSAYSNGVKVSLQ